MRIITLNANGIRAAARKGFFDWLDKTRYFLHGDTTSIIMMRRRRATVVSPFTLVKSRTRCSTVSDGM